MKAVGDAIPAKVRAKYTHIFTGQRVSRKMTMAQALDSARAKMANGYHEVALKMNRAA